jgi:hypothetical protein
MEALFLRNVRKLLFDYKVLHERWEYTTSNFLYWKTHYLDANIRSVTEDIRSIFVEPVF